jgi:hypothetical protein
LPGRVIPERSPLHATPLGTNTGRADAGKTISMSYRHRPALQALIWVFAI